MSPSDKSTSIYLFTDLQIYRSTNLQIYRSTDLLVYWSTGLLVYWSTGLSLNIHGYHYIDTSLHVLSGNSRDPMKPSTSKST